MSVSNVRYLGKKMAPAHTNHARSVPKAQRSKGGNGHPSIFNVKLPKLKKKGSGVEKTPSRGSPEPAAKRAKTSQTQGALNESDSIGEDVYCFPEEPASKKENKKEKVKLAVLKTISKELEANRLIRQRLAALRRAHSSCTE